MQVLRPGAETGSDGNRYAAIATPSRGASELVLVRATKDPGAASAAHRHDREEIVHVLTGRARAVVEGHTIALEPGETLLVAPGELHQVSTLGDRALECLVVKPAGIRFLSPDGDELPPPEWML